MPIWNNYYLAVSLQEALDVLASSKGSVRCIGGGTDLLLDLQQERHEPIDTLVDVTGVEEMSKIELRNQELFVGAGVPLSRIVQSEDVACHAEGLKEAAGLIGGPQVRNTATLGGNVAHALPAADGTIALVALGADAEIASMQEGQVVRRRVPILELFIGPGQSSLDNRRDILSGFYINLKKSAEASVHKRIMRPQGVAIAILNMSVWVKREEDLVRDIRIAIGPAGPTPIRARKTEQFLIGKPYQLDRVKQALAVLLSETQFRTSKHRATAEYRREMAGVLLEETVLTAWQRSAI